MFRTSLRPAQVARQYQRAGAKALSVLTDAKYFGGSSQILRQVRAATRLPILRKDFVIDPYQVWESRLLGADAILLIARILSGRRMKVLSRLAHRLGLDCLFEVHDRADLGKVLPVKPRMVGINNRDLGDFKVDLGVTERLLPHLKSSNTLVVSESGIQTPEDVARMELLGVRAVLVGESLMKAAHPGKALMGLRKSIKIRQDPLNVSRKSQE